MKIISKLKYLIIPIFLLTGCTLFKNDSMENINIITTIYPLEYITNYLYGNNSIVNSIYPDDINTDTYVLTEKQLSDNSRKDLFIYMGISNDSDLAIDLINRNKNLKLIDATYGMEYKTDISELWLNPSNLLMILQNIKNGLDEYISNTYLKMEINDRFNELKLILSEADANIKVTIENSTKKTIFTNSNSLKFLERYGLKVNVIQKDNKYFEKNIALLNDAISNKTVKYIYMIEDSEPIEEIQKLVDDKKIELLTFRNIKNITDKERNEKMNYNDILSENLENLKKEIY